jgi:hypothetical protein
MSHRAEWTAFIEGKEAAPASKYHNKRIEFNGKVYDSVREAGWAANFQALRDRGLIVDYKEQERIVLVPGDGKLRPIVYVADFTFVEAATGRKRVMDAKGFKTQVYRLKKRMAALLLGIEIEEL